MALKLGQNQLFLSLKCKTAGPHLCMYLCMVQLFFLVLFIMMKYTYQKFSILTISSDVQCWGTMVTVPYNRHNKNYFQSCDVIPETFMSTPYPSPSQPWYPPFSFLSLWFVCLTSYKYDCPIFVFLCLADFTNHNIFNVHLLYHMLEFPSLLRNYPVLCILQFFKSIQVLIDTWVFLPFGSF